ncbi:hypothetical protein [Paenibacillus ginsengarvi]|uniref:Uncharacterized protein n=1 Tax=Paenibacillus ginsengarvi TaxID=400777 RepID=A0A3B0CJP1_9BACL|nr:hypothetical protein [Paenibacillus ginsengarvi]RKN84489.1 hypothetical protein D7M11_13505 [Paenibacillus ginsengarvi]
MKESKPDWYARLKNDPFRKKTFTDRTISRIERLAEEGRSNSYRARGTRSAAIGIAAGLIIVLLVFVSFNPYAPYIHNSTEVGKEADPPSVKERHGLQGDGDSAQAPNKADNAPSVPQQKNDGTEEAVAPPREDVSVRAIGTHSEGLIVIKPANQAKVAALGAASCYGQETDLNWRGDYAVYWEPKTGGATSLIFTFPIDFEIIQRGDTPVEMKKFQLGGTELFAYTPRYTDCHALETYVFGVADGKAFSVPFEMDAKRSLSNLGRLPIRELQITDEELIITGGYGAGQDFIDVYHFLYDPKKKSLILQTTDQLKPNELKSNPK